MASISNNNVTGRRTIQFIGVDGRRRSIRLGKISKRQAEAIKLRVEDLAAASISGHPAQDETSRWVAALNDELRGKLAAVGLVKPQARLTLAAFLTGYIAKRSDVKASTTLVYGHTQRNLIELFGEDRPIRSITPGDVDEWRLYLIEAGLADNTVRRRCGIA